MDKKDVSSGGQGGISPQSMYDDVVCEIREGLAPKAEAEDLTDTTPGTPPVSPQEDTPTLSNDVPNCDTKSNLQVKQEQPLQNNMISPKSKRVAFQGIEQELVDSERAEEKGLKAVEAAFAYIDGSGAGEEEEESEDKSWSTDDDDDDTDEEEDAEFSTPPAISINKTTISLSSSCDNLTVEEQKISLPAQTQWETSSQQPSSQQKGKVQSTVKPLGMRQQNIVKPEAVRQELDISLSSSAGGVDWSCSPRAVSKQEIQLVSASIGTRETGATRYGTSIVAGYEKGICPVTPVEQASQLTLPVSNL